jgi:hypothetical protein
MSDHTLKMDIGKYTRNEGVPELSPLSLIYTKHNIFRRAINAMNNLYPLATEQELREGDNTCIICREEMTVESGAKKLPCNHIFHPNCLRSWFQRQQTCPTCRTDVLGGKFCVSYLILSYFSNSGSLTTTSKWCSGARRK